MSFIPSFSTDEICVGENNGLCLTDKIEDMDSEIEGKADTGHSHTAAQVGAAAENHSHEGFATEGHSHTPAEIGAAVEGHTHDDYAVEGHTHLPSEIGAAPASHTHTPESVGAAAATHIHNEYASAGHTHNEFAGANHVHIVEEVTGLSEALAAKANVADLTAKADLVDGKVPTSQLPSYVDDVVDAHIVSGATAFSAGWLSETNGGAALTPAADKVYVVVTSGEYQGKTYRWSGTVYAPIGEDLALGETAATAFRGDHGKVAYEHSQNGDVHVTEAQKTAWNGKAAGNHTHTPASIGAAAASHTHDYAASGHNHDADYIAKALQPTTDTGSVEKAYYVDDNVNILTKLEEMSQGIHTAYTQPAVEGSPNTTEAFRFLLHKTNSNIMWLLAFGSTGSLYSNYWNGGTWRGWRQIYTTGNKPTAADVGAIANTLQFTADNGNVQYSFGADSGKNILTEINSWGIGLHTAYAIAGTEGNPNTEDSFRYLVHKTSANIGWVIAFGGHGSVYTNYDHAGVFRGWRCLYDTENNALWTGGLFMNAGHTATPSKKLSECRNGWMLEWSDYDADTGTVNNYNIVQTPIYKRNVLGTWGGQNMMVCVPSYINSDGGSVTMALKQLVVHDDKIVGNALNSTGSINIDVVLRAVYEF